MRLLIVSTPRSGNMWARRLLRRLYDLEERSTHTVEGLDWERLPERCVVQLHADRTPDLEQLLDRYGFQRVVLARHPLDVLVSILHFARHEPETAQWLEGRGGDEHTILDADPTSRAFVRYATGARASALLHVTPQWWETTPARIRYRNLVWQPTATLAEVVEALDEQPRTPVERAIDDVTFSTLKQEARNQHFWRGQPDGWRYLLTPRIAHKIVRAHRDVFDELGWVVEPDESLSKRMARAHWRELLVPSETNAA